MNPVNISTVEMPTIEPVIPEFHSWIILSLFVTATLIVTIYRKRLNKLRVKFLLPNQSIS